MKNLFQDIKKGDLVYYVKHNVNSFELQVTKVTDEYIYTTELNLNDDIKNHKYFKHKFHVENGLEITTFGAGGKLYPSKQSYETIQENIEIKNTINKNISIIMENKNVEEINVLLTKINQFLIKNI